MEKKSRLNITSLVLCISACLASLILLLFIISTGKRFTELYGEFSLHIPFLSKIFMSSYTLVFFIILLIALIIKERLKNKKFTLIINILGLFIIGISFLLHAIALFLPILNLTESRGVSQEDARKIISPSLNSQDPEERVQALRNLGQTKDPRHIPTLINAFKDENKSVRYYAATYALVEIGESAVEPLITVLKDENFDVRISAAMALGEIGDRRAIEPLINALRDEEDKDKVIYYSSALEKIGEPAVEPLIGVLKDGNVNLRVYAAQALGKIGDYRAIEPLIDAIKDENSLVRHSAIGALGEIGRPAIEFLITLLKNENISVRSAAISALGKIKDTRAVDSLILIIQDENVFDRISAIMALGEIGDSRTIEPLIAVLKDDNENIRGAAASSLKRITGKHTFGNDYEKWQEWWEKEKANR